MTSVDQVQRLLDMAAIHALKAKYCRAIDTKQWSLLSTVFTLDASFDGFGSAPSGADVTTFVTGVANRLERAVSVHHCHTPEIVFVTQDTARAVWAMQDYLEWPEPISLKESERAFGFIGYGHYEEQYQRTDAGWLMSYLRLTRLRLVPLTSPSPALGDQFLRADPNWLVQQP